MNKTNIEWVRNPDGSQGYTWNPITGCLNHIDGICQGGNFPCYAYRLANGRLKDRYLANKNTATRNYDEDCYPFYPRFWPERLKELQPIGGLVCELVYPPKTPKGIFVCDMSDLFGIGIPHEWTEAVLNMIKKWPAHRFYLLTKQPQNLVKWSPFPDNCWVGQTLSRPNQRAIDYFSGVQAKVKFLSIEPMLGQFPWDMNFGSINWLIIGAQTKPYKPPKIEWVQEIAEAADQAGIPVFLKNNLSDLIPVNSSLRYGPAGELRLRQEMPTHSHKEY